MGVLVTGLRAIESIHARVAPEPCVDGVALESCLDGAVSLGLIGGSDED